MKAYVENPKIPLLKVLVNKTSSLIQDYAVKNHIRINNNKNDIAANYELIFNLIDDQINAGESPNYVLVNTITYIRYCGFETINDLDLSKINTLLKEHENYGLFLLALKILYEDVDIDRIFNIFNDFFDNNDKKLDFLVYLKNKDLGIYYYEADNFFNELLFSNNFDLEKIKTIIKSDDLFLSNITTLSFINRTKEEIHNLVYNYLYLNQLKSLSDIEGVIVPRIINDFGFCYDLISLFFDKNGVDKEDNISLYLDLIFNTNPPRNRDEIDQMFGLLNKLSKESDYVYYYLDLMSIHDSYSDNSLKTYFLINTLNYLKDNNVNIMNTLSYYVNDFLENTENFNDYSILLSTILDYYDYFNNSINLNSMVMNHMSGKGVGFINDENDYNLLLDGLEHFLSMKYTNTSDNDNQISSLNSYLIYFTLLSNINFYLTHYDHDFNYKNDRFNELLVRLAKKYIDVNVKDNNSDTTVLQFTNYFSNLVNNNKLVYEVYDYYNTSLIENYNNNYSNFNSSYLSGLLCNISIKNDDELNDFLAFIDRVMNPTTISTQEFYDSLFSVLNRSSFEYSEKIVDYLIENHLDQLSVPQFLRCLSSINDIQLVNKYINIFIDNNMIDMNNASVLNSLNIVYGTAFSYADFTVPENRKLFFDILNKLLDNNSNEYFYTFFESFLDIKNDNEVEYELDEDGNFVDVKDNAIDNKRIKEYDLDLMLELSGSYYKTYDQRLRDTNNFIYPDKFAAHLSSFDDKYMLLISIFSQHYFSKYNSSYNNVDLSYFLDLNQDVDNIIEQISRLSNDENINNYLVYYNLFNNISKKIEHEKLRNLFFNICSTFGFNFFNYDYTFEKIFDLLRDLKLLNDEELIKLVFDNLEIMSIDDIIHAFKCLNNRHILLDYDVMKDYINEDLIKKLGSQGYLYLITGTLTWQDSLIREENKYVQEGRVKELLYKYKHIGYISDEVLNKLYFTVCNYIKDLSYEEFIQKITDVDLLKNIFTLGYKDELYILKLIAIFPKTRFKAMLDAPILKNMTLDACEKFNLKVWNKLLSNPLFSSDISFKSVLPNIMMFGGLLEKDNESSKRLNTLLKLFNISNMLYTENDIEDDVEYFEPVDVYSYTLRYAAVVPDDLASILTIELTEKDMYRLLNLTGNVGSLVNKFLYPYSKDGDVWRLKRGVDISRFSNYLKPVMTDDEMTNLKNDYSTPSEVLHFLEPYQKEVTKKYRFKSDIKDYSMFVDLLKYDRSTFNVDCLHRLFGNITEFNPEIFDFFVQNFDLIIKNLETQSAFKNVVKNFSTIKTYFLRRGNSNPTFTDMYRFIKSGNYNTEFGNEEFAEDAKNNEVTPEGFKYYQELLAKTRARKLSTVPRHNKTYDITLKNGKKYKILTKILRSDDPFNLLVGEKHFTGCCQRYNDWGQTCMEHASTSKNGAIFVTYLIEDGKEKMLTQSWTWTNESKLCFDNVEGTDVLKSNPDRHDLTEAVMEAISLASKDLIKISAVKVEEYYKKEVDKLKKSTLSDEEKLKKLEELNEFRRRQKISIVTVGEGYDDLNVKERFTKIDREESTEGPKDSEFVNYSDSTMGQQHVIQEVGSSNKSSNKFKERPIYRDNREIKVEIGNNISHYTLKRISDIEDHAHKDQMKLYKNGDSYVILDPYSLADIYYCDTDSLRVIIGEDWYYVYSVDDTGIEVYDMAKDNPRFDDEAMSQTAELSQAFNMILKDAIVLDDSGKVIDIKEIRADLREDTSYLLYLTQIKRGIIEQVGEDYAYKYGEDYDSRVVSIEEQNETLSKMREIKKSGNPELMMHKVVFKPTLKTVEKLYGKKVTEGRRI